MADSSRPDEALDETKHEWTVFLLGRHPWRGVFALATCLLFSWFTWSFTQSAWMTGLAAFVLLASLAGFFFPTRYRVDPEGVRTSNFIYRRTRRWIEFRGVRRQENRLKLLTLPYDSRLDNYRGMLLILPEQPESILAYIRARIEEAHGDPA